jgi:hypothetical protein
MGPSYEVFSKKKFKSKDDCEITIAKYFYEADSNPEFVKNYRDIPACFIPSSGEKLHALHVLNYEANHTRCGYHLLVMWRENPDPLRKMKSAFNELRLESDDIASFIANEVLRSEDDLTTKFASLVSQVDFKQNAQEWGW